LEAGAAAFARAAGLFEALIGDLADRGADAMTAFDLEVMISERGREVMLELRHHVHPAPRRRSVISALGAAPHRAVADCMSFGSTTPAFERGQRSFGMK
jgi:hypothetical protein